jgi:hypothetical protein
MENLDGNAAAGVLREVFGTEMTGYAGTCGSCGTTAALGESAAFTGGPGTVLRCARCDGLLIGITRVRGVRCVDLMGLAALDPPA